MNRKKWRKYIAEKGLDPSVNRKKFGKLLFVVTLLVFALFILRFAFIVVVGRVAGESLKEKTQQLYQGSSVMKAKRGTIYDRNGDPIAEDATSYSLYANLDKEFLGLADPKTEKREKLYVQEKDKAEIARVLESELGLSKEYVLDRLKIRKNSENKPITYVEFGSQGKGLSLEKKEKIEKSLEKLHIKGIYFKQHSARNYPNGVFSSHFIGYTELIDRDDEDKGLKGMMGIEAAYNKELAGQNGVSVYQKDSHQYPVPGTVVEKKKKIDGQDIFTTLDINLELYLEELMDQVFNTYKPTNISAMLVEAKTGNVLAATQRPSFNATTKKGLGDKGFNWYDLLVEDPYEPGSTMKAFTVAAAIDQGMFDAGGSFMSGKIQVQDRTISDHIPSGRGPMTYRQALAWSSNVGMVHLEQNMGDGWQAYLKRFGFGKSTHSHLLGESSGNIQSENLVDRAMTAYGQAISVTPFQMVQGYTAIANQGKMLKPRYISKFVTSDGKTKENPVKVVRQVVEPTTASQVLDMMTDVVEDREYGTGFGVFGLEGYRVSAKTGTAQIIENGGYIPNQYLYSVVQIAPTENPEYIMYVTIKKPPEGAEMSPARMVASISNPLLKRALDLDVAHQVIEEPIVKKQKVENK